MEKCGCEAESILDKLFIPIGCKVEQKLKISRLEARVIRLEAEAKVNKKIIYEYKWALHRHACSIHINDDPKEVLFSRMDTASKDWNRIKALGDQDDSKLLGIVTG
jgi:hypothetical protein